MYFDDSLVYLLCLACQKKLVDKSSYGVSLSIEIQKYCLSYHLLSSVSFIAEVTSDIEADNWSGKFFSQHNNGQNELFQLITAIVKSLPDIGAI